MKSPTHNEQELLNHIKALDLRLLALEDPDCTLTACAKGAIEGTVNLMEELLFLKSRVEDLETKQTKLIQNVKKLWQKLKTLKIWQMM